MITAWQLRARFALGLAELYGREVPAYTTLVDVASQVNSAVVAELGDAAQRLGGIDRVTAERHGAIRVGTPAELAQVGRIFAAFGMYPVGFYDLRDANPPIPVISTAFRPVDADELERNPFRVFTSLLAVDDSRFFDADLRADLHDFLGKRELFAPRLLALADRAVTAGGLDADDADEFLRLAIGTFALSSEPVDAAWYRRLAQVSVVAADIGGIASTHINHLTPRVLDIDQLYKAMLDRGIEMIDEIQGPPRWGGPDLLLRQTSFRALAEARTFREPDGEIRTGELRVRFGEVEARGIALTPSGRDIYDRMMGTENPVAAFNAELPATEAELAAADLAFFTFSPQPRTGDQPSSLSEAISSGWVAVSPQVYEDFLPRSAAGIFASNLTGEAAMDADGDAAGYDADWLAGAVQARVHDPMDLYAARRDASLTALARDLPFLQRTVDEHRLRSNRSG